MKTILTNFDILYEIEHSKFYGFSFHIENEEDFKYMLKHIQKEYPKATHYCYAYILENKQKSNDDGEPSGTAGIPILETIKNYNLTNVGIVVVRYFGGIKLGTGGLGRAYSHTAKLVIEKSKINEIIDTNTYNIVFNYDLVNVIDKFVSNNIQILNKDFGELVTYTIATNNPSIKNELTNLCNGKISIIDIGITKITI